MQNRIFRLTLLTCALTFSAFSLAQSIFDFGKKNTSSDSQGAANSQVMTPAEFKSNVKKMNQENRNNLTQQAKDEFIKQPPVASPGMPGSVSSTPSSPPPTEQPQQPAPALPTQNTPNPATPSSMAPPPTTGQRAPTYTPPPPPAPATAPTQPQGQQTQPYSGFGTGNTNKNNAPPSNNSGGWNIKY